MGVWEGHPIGQKGFMDFLGGDDPASMIMKRYCHFCEFADPLAVPIAIHINDLKKVVHRWLEKTAQIRLDKNNWPQGWEVPAAQIPWCSEMYGYMFGSAEIGLRHTVLGDFQVLGTDTFLGNAPIIHYSLEIHLGDNKTWVKSRKNAGKEIPWPIKKYSNPVAQKFLETVHDAFINLKPTNKKWVEWSQTD